MTYTAIDCMGFAGGFTLGVVQAGFKLIGKREKRGGFGARNCEANRSLLGAGWQTEATDPSEWSVPDGGASLVFGNPPCSGFSVLSSPKFRGQDSTINRCMWDFVEYAARVRPEVAVFESVQLAYSQGQPLMQALRNRLDELTGARYHLYHVLHNALSVGGPAMRKRYFWVASRVPFGVELPQLTTVPRLRDVIGDLQTLDRRWDDQSYLLEPTRYSRRLRDRPVNDLVDIGDLVDGHIGVDNPHIRRTQELLDAVDWHPNEHIQQTTRRYFDKYGDLPKGWQHLVDRLKGRDFFQGFNTPIMWHPDHPARVVTGGALLHAIHWNERRFFTHREAARIMGFPDSWLINPLRGTSGLFLTWGKGITVDCGRWVASWVRRALNGTSGADEGVTIGERESLIDVTNAWKTACGTVKPEVKIKVKWRENTVTEVATTEASADGRKGRPRPTEVVERDDRVFAALEMGGLSRETIAARTGLTPNKVYLSLWRLKRDERVKPVRHEGAQLWERVAGAV